MTTSNLLILNSTAKTATILLSGLSSSTSVGRQSATIDFGSPRAEEWLCTLQTGFTAAPAAGGTVDVYMSMTNDTTNFPGKCTGSEGAYGGPDNIAINGVKTLQFVGSFIACATGGVASQNIGTLRAVQQYGVAVAYIATSTALQTGSLPLLTFTPVIPQSQ